MDCTGYSAHNCEYSTSNSHSKMINRDSGLVINTLSGSTYYWENRQHFLYVDDVSHHDCTTKVPGFL